MTKRYSTRYKTRKRSFTNTLHCLCLVTIITIGIMTMAFSAPLNRFTVSGTQIIDPDGNEFIVKGVNAFASSSEHYDKIVNCWGFNTVLANHFPDWYWYNPDYEIDLLVAAYSSNKKVVILDLAHDALDSDSGIGHYWLPRIKELVNLYSYYADRYKNNPYVWFQLINEPDTLTFNSEAWISVHQQLITAIRNTGNQNPILVNGWCWGQDACGWGNYTITEQDSAILGLGDQILNYNGIEQQNIIFNHHVYDQFQYNDLSRLTDYHDAIQAKGYALIVGEYGAANINSTLKATKYMFESTKPRKIGRIVWSWFGAGSGSDLTIDGEYGSGAGINDCHNPTNLTPLGQMVWDDNHS